MLSADIAHLVPMVTLSPAIGSTNLAELYSVNVVTEEAAMVSPSKRCVVALATVPTDDVSVSVKPDAVAYSMPFVVQATAEILWLAVTRVAVAAPSVGVTRTGDVASTKAPLPVSSVIAAAKFALVGVPKNVATPAARPETPVETGRPVAFVSTPDAGVPSAGVTSTGDVANTNAPVPVSSVTAAARLALVGVPKKVATPAAKPETPVEIGSPVVLVRTPLEGVPNAGVTSTGDVANTKEPVPVSSVIAAARFALVGVASHVAKIGRAHV